MIIKKFLNVVLWSLLVVCSSLEAPQIDQKACDYFSTNFNIHLSRKDIFPEDVVDDITTIYNHAKGFTTSARVRAAHSAIPNMGQAGADNPPSILLFYIKKRVGEVVPAVKTMTTKVDISLVSSSAPRPPLSASHSSPKKSSSSHMTEEEASSTAGTGSQGSGSRSSEHRSGAHRSQKKALEDGGNNSVEDVVSAMQAARKHSVQLLATPGKPAAAGKGKKETPWSPPPKERPPVRRLVFSPPPGQPPANARRTAILTPSPGALVLSVHRTSASGRPVSTPSARARAATTIQRIARGRSQLKKYQELRKKMRQQGGLGLQGPTTSDQRIARRGIAHAKGMTPFLGSDYVVGLVVHGTPPPPPPSKASSTDSGASRPVRKKRPPKKTSTLPSESLEIKAALNKVRSIPMSSEKEEIADALRNARSFTHEEARRASKRQKS